MNIVYSHDDYFDIYTCNNEKTISKQRYFDSLENVLKHVNNDCKTTFLLNESNFHYYSFRIECTSREEFTIADQKSFINEKLHWIRRHEGIKAKYCNHLISDRLVSGKPSEYCIGKKGEIAFTLSFFVLKHDSYRSFQQVLGSDFLKLHHASATIVPKSFYLIQHLSKTLKKRDYAVLMIFQNECQLLCINNGFYSRFESVNMGESLLKACYKEHNIDQYFYESYEAIESNSLLQKLVQDSLSFYSQQLCTWLQQYLVQGYELMIMTDMIENPLFIPTLQKHYNEHNNGFIVPLHSMFYVTEYNYAYSPTEIPMITSYMVGSEK